MHEIRARALAPALARRGPYPLQLCLKGRTSGLINTLPFDYYK